jgi:stage III sporulation protein AC
MDIGLIIKIAGIGMLVSVISSILSKSGRDEQAMLVGVAGMIAVMLMLLEEMSELLDALRSVFGL